MTQDLQGGRAKKGSAGVLHPAARACHAAETAQTAVTAEPRPVAHAQRRVSQERVYARETEKQTTEAHPWKREEPAHSEQKAVAKLERRLKLPDAMQLPADRCGSGD